jgi:hypothetical protein
VQIAGKMNLLIEKIKRHINTIDTKGHQIMVGIASIDTACFELAVEIQGICFEVENIINQLENANIPKTQQ